MPIATLYKASGEAEPIEAGDYLTRTPGIAHGEPQHQLSLDHIAQLIDTDPNHVEFTESYDGQRIAYASDGYGRPLNAFAVAHSVLKLRGDVLEVPYFNTIDY
jgi:hypothetical protein